MDDSDIEGGFTRARQDANERSLLGYMVANWSHRQPCADVQIVCDIIVCLHYWEFIVNELDISCSFGKYMY